LAGDRRPDPAFWHSGSGMRSSADGWTSEGGDTDLGVTGMTPSETTEGVDPKYAVAVGARLRAVRRQKRLSLQAVEKTSGLEFKASVLGAYERGERTISVPRLQRLAKLYRVPVDQLLPVDAGEPPSAGRAPSRHSNGESPDSRDKTFKIAVDLTRLAEAQGPERELLRRFLSTVQLQRQDFNGEVLTIRSDDLRVMASMLGQSLDVLLKRLEELGILRA
jgi:transcriptional regulator with XRE-family HTH domain